MSVYKKVKYPLSYVEIKKIDEVWIFLECFFYSKVNLHKYRRHVIEEIVKKYDPEDFLFYEKIIEKLIFNLKHHLKEKIKLKTIKLSDGENFIETIKEYSATSNTTQFRSFINKNFYYKKNTIYISDLKGSSSILRESDFDKLLNDVMFNRQKYERIFFEKVESIEQYYYSFDYPFPNIFLGKFNLVDRDSERLKRIVKMYFDGEFNWFKLIK